MKPRLIAILFWSLALSSFAGADNEFIEKLDILQALVNSADRSGAPLRTEIQSNKSGDEKLHYFVSTAHFIGQFQAPFGSVYVAQLIFTLSSERGSKIHSRHYGYICFFDNKLKLRKYWFISQPSPLFYGSHSKILDSNDNVIFDFDSYPKNDRVFIDDHVESAPRW